MTCPAHCCTAESKGEGIAFLTLRDAERVKKATGMKISEFADVFEFEDEEEVERYLKSEHHGDRLFGGLAHELQMLSLKSKKNSATCTFLRKNKMCSIYEARPMICRMFPLWFNRERGKIKFTKHNDGPPKDEACPVLKKNPTSKEVMGLMNVDKKMYELAEQYYQEMKEYETYKHRINENLDKVLKSLPKPKYKKVL